MWNRFLRTFTVTTCCLAISACGVVGEGSEPLDYRYVMIENLGASLEPVVRLDAVSLSKGGTTYYINNVEDAEFGEAPPASGVNDDFDQALGPPESSTGTCDSNDPYYVNMGGPGGFLIGSFDEDITVDVGDTLVVHVCSSAGSPGGEYSAKVGVEPLQSAASWVMCMVDAVGTATCTVPDLPAEAE